jgi:hypothetical protein
MVGSVTTVCYGADGRLWPVDARLRRPITDGFATWEEYRYDHYNYATVRRTVWDGDQVLYEIHMAESKGDSDGMPSP